MSDAVLRELFRAQAGRLGRALAEQLAAPKTEVARIAPLLHTLKAAALSAGEAELATRCHDVESALLSAEPSVWHAELTALLAALDDRPGGAAITRPALLKALRSSFVASLKAAGVRGLLRLDIDEAWLVHAEILLDVLPHLLRNAVAHGGEAPAERVSVGKPEALQVSVRARLLATAVPPRLTLVVTDDGRGTARPASAKTDLLAGRGWGVAAVRTALAALPASQLRYRGVPGRGSAVRITSAI